MGRKTDLQTAFDVVYSALVYCISSTKIIDDFIEINIDGKTFVVSVKEKEENNYKMKSTDFLKVNITDINWDIDDGEEKPSDLKSKMNVLFKINDVAECLEINNGNYKINDEALNDFLSDYISDTTGFCHNGFNYTYEILKQKNLSHIHF